MCVCVCVCVCATRDNRHCKLLNLLSVDSGTSCGPYEPVCGGLECKHPSMYWLRRRSSSQPLCLSASGSATQQLDRLHPFIVETVVDCKLAPNGYTVRVVREGDKRLRSDGRTRRLLHLSRAADGRERATVSTTAHRGYVLAWKPAPPNTFTKFKMNAVFTQTHL